MTRKLSFLPACSSHRQIYLFFCYSIPSLILKTTIQDSILAEDQQLVQESSRLLVPDWDCCEMQLLGLTNYQILSLSGVRNPLLHSLDDIL